MILDSQKLSKLLHRWNTITSNWKLPLFALHSPLCSLSVPFYGHPSERLAMIYLHTHQPFSAQVRKEAILSFQLSVLYIPFVDPELAANDLSLICFFILCLPGLTGSRTRQIARRRRRLSPRQLSSELKFLNHFSYALKWIKARGVGFCGGPLSSMAIAFNHCNNDQRNEISSNSIWIFPFFLRALRAPQT